MDNINQKILTILQKNARISFSDLAKKVHLSAPAVADRVKKLEENGTIKKYRTELDIENAGYAITAMVQVKVFFGRENDFIQLAKQQPEILECHNVTGEKSYLLKVVLTKMSELDALLEKFSNLSETNSMILLSTLFDNDVIPR